MKNHPNNCTKCGRSKPDDCKSLCVNCIVVSHCSKLRNKVKSHKINLTEDQIYAVAKIKTFKTNVHEHIFLLSGPGGVGKTHVLKQFASRSTAFVTPTHKSSMVLAKRVGQKCETLHRFMGCEQRYDRNGKQVYVDNTHTDSFCIKMKKIKLIVLDEASMVGYEMYKRLMQVVHEHDVKLLVVGDPAQLPPVVRTPRYECEQAQIPPFYYYHSIDFELTKNVRNDNPTYNELLSYLRSCILDREYTRDTTYKIDELINRYCHEMQQTDDEAMQSVSAVDEDDIIVLAHRTNPNNNVVAKLNAMVRNSRFNNPKELFVEGEKIMFNSYFQTKHETYHTCSPEVVCGVGKTEKDYNGDLFKCYELTLGSGSVVHYPLEEELERFKDKMIAYKNYVTEKTLKMKSTDDITNTWAMFYNDTNRVKAPIEYRYALSIHKSQGSSYDYIFSKVTDFKWMKQVPKMVDQYHKLLYVALSRSRSSGSVF